jgi:CubicO group peptidase (beta-lactamase class C family)
MIQSVDEQFFKQILERASSSFRGPGGAAAILKDGELVSQHVWGYADIDKRIPMTTQTMMPICSITKQMLCMLLFDLSHNPAPAMIAQGDIWSQLLSKLREFLPHEISTDKNLTISRMCNNQSGIRDYWALSVLWGSKPDGRFSITEHGPKARERLKSFHFQPGTQYSYCNTNFHILARLVEIITLESLEGLLAQRVFGPAGMKTAKLCADNANHPQPIIGYEGDEQHGFLPAVNRMEWSGDAGVVASLTDMIAYEMYADRSWREPQSLYRAIAEPQLYADGTSATYGYGLAHGTVGEVVTVGHSGALRGFRLQRLHAPSERLSVVVMFNHEADAKNMARSVLMQLLGQAKPTSLTVDPVEDWVGVFFDSEAQLIITIKKSEPGKILVDYAGSPEEVILVEGSRAQSPDMYATIDGDSLRIHRLKENRVFTACRVKKRDGDINTVAYLGKYHCDSIDSAFHCAGEGEMLYGLFEGFLGQGPPHLMRYIGEDIWELACPRGLDAPAPGYWTVVFHRENEVIVGVTIGCWLARKLEYVKKALEEGS